MSLPNTKKRSLSPTHPGEMLREDFMPDFGLNVSSLATALGVSRQTANELVQCRRAVSPVMALRLSHLFGNSSMFWLNAQNVYDLWHAERRHRKELEAVVLLKAA
ncbi:MAG: addiction module antidote protein, HigA family [Geobacter sp.]|nr:MAG: addiction module antidote protein, HigA family [Geobacter sp.]